MFSLVLYGIWSDFTPFRLKSSRSVIHFYLTNRETLTVLCCKSRRERLKHERSVGRNTRLSRVFLPLLECSGRFLSALKQKRAHLNFSICFIIKNPLNSPSKLPSITFNFQNKLYFQSEQQCRQHALYSHKARYNKPIRIPVRMVQIIWLAVLD